MAVASPAGPEARSPTQVMQRAAALYGSGQWAEAEQLCRDTLPAAPGDFDLLHLLAIIAARTGRLTTQGADDNC